MQYKTSRDKDDAILHMTVKLDKFYLDLTTNSFGIIDALTKFVGLEKVMRTIFILMSLIVVQPQFMR